MQSTFVQKINQELCLKAHIIMRVWVNTGINITLNSILTVHGWAVTFSRYFGFGVLKMELEYDLWFIANRHCQLQTAISYFLVPHDPWKTVKPLSITSWGTAKNKLWMSGKRVAGNHLMCHKQENIKNEIFCNEICYCQLFSWNIMFHMKQHQF
jgi:hypothetical protein